MCSTSSRAPTSRARTAGATSRPPCAAALRELTIRRFGGDKAARFAQIPAEPGGESRMSEATDGLEAFVRGLPKAELHLHIEGSLEPEQMFEFGRRNKVDMLFVNVEAVRAAYEFSNLQDFLDIYYQCAGVLLT